MAETLLERARSAHHDVVELQLAMRRAAARRDDVVRTLVDHGIPVAEIATALGLSHQRVSRIVNGPTSTRTRAEVEPEIFGLVGHEVDLHSWRVVARVLYDELGIDPAPGHRRSVSTHALTALRRTTDHPVVPLLLEWRYARRSELEPRAG